MIFAVFALTMIALLLGGTVVLFFLRESKANRRQRAWEAKWARVEREFVAIHGRAMTEDDWEDYYARHPSEANSTLYDD